MRAFLLIGLAGLATVAIAAKEAEMNTLLPRARDGNVAIQEELEAARRAATVAAYDLFIARHPGHPLEAVARREREVLARRGAARPRPGV